jgi:type III restriction enzyme
VICDYPLAQAVEDKIVKAPLIVYGEAKGKRLSDDPQHVNRDNVAQKYEFWIKASVDRWKEHSKISVRWALSGPFHHGRTQRLR